MFPLRFIAIVLRFVGAGNGRWNMPQKKMKFKRTGLTPKKDMKDERGNVKIQVMLVSSGNNGRQPVKGNISKSVTLSAAKVSEVFAAIENAIID